MKLMLNPFIAEGKATFLRELPTLAQQHRFQWVAYRGKERLDILPRPDSFYRIAADRGIPESELLIRHIDPDGDDDQIECRLVDFDGEF